MFKVCSKLIKTPEFGQVNVSSEIGAEKKIDRFSNFRNTLLVNLVAPVFPISRNQPVDMIAISVLFIYDTITDSFKIRR